MRRYFVNIYDLGGIHRQRQMLKRERPKVVMRQRNLYDLSSRTIELVREPRRKPCSPYDVSAER